MHSMTNDDSIPFEEELPIRSIKPTFVTDRDGITRVVLNGRYISHSLSSGYSEELVSRLADSVIQTLIKGYLYESVKDAVRENIEQQTVNLERLECIYATQVELEYRVKPVIKNDDLDSKKWNHNNIHIDTYRENSRNEVKRSIKEMLEGNRKEY